MMLPAGVTAAAFEEALAEVVALRPYGTYRPHAELPPPTADPKCGTRRGYALHRARREQTCDTCKATEAAAARRLRATGTTIATPLEGGDTR